MQCLLTHSLRCQPAEAAGGVTHTRLNAACCCCNGVFCAERGMHCVGLHCVGAAALTQLHPSCTSHNIRWGVQLLHV